MNIRDKTAAINLIPAAERLLDTQLDSHLALRECVHDRVHMYFSYTGCICSSLQMCTCIKMCICAYSMCVFMQKTCRVCVCALYACARVQPGRLV